MSGLNRSCFRAGHSLIKNPVRHYFTGLIKWCSQKADARALPGDREAFSAVSWRVARHLIVTGTEKFLKLKIWDTQRCWKWCDRCLKCHKASHDLIWLIQKNRGAASEHPFSARQTELWSLLSLSCSSCVSTQRTQALFLVACRLMHHLTEDGKVEFGLNRCSSCLFHIQMH